MAAHWIREVTTTGTGASTGFPFASKALAMFLRFVCGFINPSQEVNRIGVGDSISAPSATKQTLTDAAGYFEAADVGRTITITNANAANNGVFTITDYVSATQVKYVNATGVVETSSFDWTITVLSQDHWTYEKNGTNGSINVSGADKTFQDATAASFAAGDTGKWLLLKDPTNPRNSGWYKVTYVDASNVSLEYRSGAAEYPTQNLGANLSWWMLGDTYQVPIRANALWQLESPHANGWAIEVQYHLPSSDQGLKVRVAASGNFAGSDILETVYVGVDNADATWFYCVADDDGSYVHFFFHNDTSNEYGGFLVSNVLLSEPGRAVNEQVALMGCQSSVASNWANTNTMERANDGTCIAWGYMWNDIAGASRIVKMMEPSYYNSAEGLTVWTGRTANSRTGSWDFIEGQPVITDDDNVLPVGEYEIIGKLQGIYLTSRQATVKTAFNDAGTKDRFHIYHGHSIAWPELTQQH